MQIKQLKLVLPVEQKNCSKLGGLDSFLLFCLSQIGMRELELIKNIGPIYYINTSSSLNGYEEVKCKLRGCVKYGKIE